MKQRIKKTLFLALIAGASLNLSGCDDVAVYGSMSVGSSWGSYYGPAYGPSYGRGSYYNNPHVSSRVTISGRIH